MDELEHFETYSNNRHSLWLIYISLNGVHIKRMVLLVTFSGEINVLIGVNVYCYLKWIFIPFSWLMLIPISAACLEWFSLWQMTPPWMKCFHSFLIILARLLVFVSMHALLTLRTYSQEL